MSEWVHFLGYPIFEFQYHNPRLCLLSIAVKIYEPINQL